MAKVYSSPIPAPDWSEYNGPDGKFNIHKMCQVEEEYKVKLLEWIKSHNFEGKTSTPFLGQIISFPVADGSADYMVAGNSCLMHIPLVDAWNFPYADRLTAQDIKEQCAQAQAIASLFGEKIS